MTDKDVQLLKDFLTLMSKGQYTMHPKEMLNVASMLKAYGALIDRIEKEVQSKEALKTAKIEEAASGGTV